VVKQVTVTSATIHCRTVPIGDLVPDAGNGRRRDERAKTVLANSLKQFGPARSIVLDGRDIVRAGNGTLEAFAANGGTEVLVIEPEPGQLVAIRRKDWSAVEATAYAIGDNRTSELATWDDVGLGDALGALKADGHNLDDLGFSPSELETLWENGADAILGDEAWPEQQAPDSHSIIVRYREQDVTALLEFLKIEDENVLTEGKAGAKILERIRQITSA
jgi:hypothetical protein